MPSRHATPVEVLAAIHDAVRSDGRGVIMDEAVADDFFVPGDPLEQVMYGYSTLICLPDGLSSTPQREPARWCADRSLTTTRYVPDSHLLRCCRSRISPSSGSTGCVIEAVLTNSA
jgi:hypothetical protein